MPTATAASRLTSKGQTTVPARFCEVLGLKPGDMVVFEQASSGEVTIRRSATPSPSGLPIWTVMPIATSAFGVVVVPSPFLIAGRLGNLAAPEQARLVAALRDMLP